MGDGGVAGPGQLLPAQVLGDGEEDGLFGAGQTAGEEGELGAEQATVDGRGHGDDPQKGERACRRQSTTSCTPDCSPSGRVDCGLASGSSLQSRRRLLCFLPWQPPGRGIPPLASTTRAGPAPVAPDWPVPKSARPTAFTAVLRCNTPRAIRAGEWSENAWVITKACTRGCKGHER